MKAKELRIGNYINHGTELIKVESIHTSKDDALINFDWEWNYFTSIVHCQPIPLTEKWLKKLGFKYSEERASMSNGFEEWENNGIYIGPLDNDNYISEALDQGGINQPIKYIHQLQNLYFALTGNELEIK